jgi:hypothetical protein
MTCMLSFIDAILFQNFPEVLTDIRMRNDTISLRSLIRESGIKGSSECSDMQIKTISSS